MKQLAAIAIGGGMVALTAILLLLWLGVVLDDWQARRDRR